MVKDIERLEGVRKFALRLCSRRWNADYADLLEGFHVPSLKGRRLFLSLLNFYKIVKELVFFPPDSFPLPVSRHGMLSKTFHPSPITLLNGLFFFFLFVCVTSNFGIVWQSRLLIVIIFIHLRRLYVPYFYNIVTN